MECIKNKKRGRNQPLFCSGEQDRTAHLRVMKLQNIFTLQYLQGFSRPKMNLKEQKSTQMHQKCDSRCDSNFSLNLDLKYEKKVGFKVQNVNIMKRDVDLKKNLKPITKTASKRFLRNNPL
jgi:hypothetical protein